MCDVDLELERLCPALPPDEADDLRQEHAAILEYCGGLSPEEADRRTGLGVQRGEHTSLQA
jgi:hypothetical protein